MSATIHALVLCSTHRCFSTWCYCSRQHDFMYIHICACVLFNPPMFSTWCLSLQYNIHINICVCVGLVSLVDAVGPSSASKSSLRGCRRYHGGGGVQWSSPGQRPRIRLPVTARVSCAWSGHQRRRRNCTLSPRFYISGVCEAHIMKWVWIWRWICSW